MALLRAFALLAAIAFNGVVSRAADLADLVRPPAAAPAAVRAQPQRPVSVRIQWGGGTPQAWVGTIEVVAADAAAGPAAARLPFTWRTLSSDADAAAFAHEADGAIAVHQPRPVATDGVEIAVADWRHARLVVRMTPLDGPQPAPILDVPLVEVVAAPMQQSLDALGNRVTAKQAPGDALRVGVASGGGDEFSTAAVGLVRRPGEFVRLRVEPLIAARVQAGSVFDLRMRLKPARQTVEIAAQSTGMRPLPEASAVVGAAGGRSLTSFEPVVFDIALPTDEGVYDVEVEAVERGSLRWSRPLCSRTVQFAVVADTPIDEPPAAEWKTVYELDPGSPRLHERLRRLPGMHLPSVPLPDMPLPAIARPTMSLPRLPNVPLPNVPLPNVAAMVPRLSGLLATGDSAVATHPLGPMLRLPPARGAGDPTWEGIALGAVQPGRPVAVEIEYPTGQDAIVGVTVLETDAAGVVAETRHAGGFEVSAARFAGTPERLAVYRFVFWPTTRHPLIVISNPATRSSATFGRVRVAAGPVRLQAMGPRQPGGPRPGNGAAVRRTFGFVSTPDLGRRFGGGGHVDPAGRATIDWVTHADAARHSAELLRAQGAGGALVTVYARGAAAWPTDLTRRAPRWDLPAPAPAAAVDEPGVRDVMGMLSKTYARHGLGFVPGLCFDAPLPAVEAWLANRDAVAGIACVGRDGRARRLEGGGLHYNVLDPRVQRAVEDVVVDAATRLRGGGTVEGIALVLPHDGWLHLPGPAWGLDDVTFGRFLAATGGGPAPEGDGRFAERARLVEGPLREPWLAWRCAEMAGFHGRLAAAVAAIDQRWCLYVVPTTLFAAGDLASGFRPALGPGADAVDAVREAGLEPAAVGPHAAGRVVFVAPHVHVPGGDIRDRATCAAANRAPAVARAAAAAGRRGIAIVEQPLEIDLADSVAHGPFGSAAAEERCLVHAARQDDGLLAESLAATDPEIVFDMRLATTCAPASAARLGFESLPAAAFAPLAGVSAPLAVRTCRAGGATWALVVNESAAPARAVLSIGGRPATIFDSGAGTALSPSAEGEVVVPLEPRSMRTLILDGDAAVERGRLEYAADVQRDVASRIERLRLRRAVLETPVPIDVLDNPGFELGGGDGGGRPAASVAGWEVVEPRRGAVSVIPGAAAGDAEQAAGAGAGRALEFSSFNGLATLRSNPFAAPTTGRMSIAVRLRVADGSPQPPLRIAIEGVQGDREYYRFAAVGGLTGGRSLTAAWSLFVLQVDDLPTESVESMRVRFDLLGPGRVQIDDVRVFDLAFDESQRVQLTRVIAGLDQRFQAGDYGGCIAALDGYWPAFLESFVTDAAVAAAEQVQDAVAAPRPKTEERQAGGMLDRVRGWWQ